MCMLRIWIYACTRRCNSVYTCTLMPYECLNVYTLICNDLSPVCVRACEQNVADHPNQWYRASVSYHKAKADPSGRGGKSLGDSATQAQAQVKAEPAGAAGASGGANENAVSNTGPSPSSAEMQMQT
jgi:hypothetical protein